MLNGYRQKLSLLYATHYGRVAAVLGALVVLVSSIFPVVLPIFLVLILAVSFLPSRDDQSLAHLEILERIPDPRDDNQVGNGFLHWLPLPSLLAVLAMAVVMESGLRTVSVVESLGPFSNHLLWLCELASAQGYNDVTCEAVGFSTVLTAHFFAIEWIVVSSVIYLYLNRSIYLSGLHLNRSVFGNVLFSFLFLIISVASCGGIYLLLNILPETIFVSYTNNNIEFIDYKFGDYIGFILFHIIYWCSFYSAYVMALMTYFFLAHAVVSPLRAESSESKE